MEPYWYRSTKMITNVGWNIAIGFCKITCNQTIIFWELFYFRTSLVLQIWDYLTDKILDIVRFGFNVWLGIIGSRIIGPIIFEGPLTGARYLRFLQNEIEDILDELPLNLWHGMYFQQDGAPPHNSRIVIDYLQRRFGEKVISMNGPVRWPPRSPDLTPLIFLFELRVRRAINCITAQQLANVLRETAMRVQKCMSKNNVYILGLEQNSRIPTVIQAAAYRYPVFQVAAARPARRGAGGDCDAKQVPYLFSPLKVARL
ncbi:hypothetical protein NQ318_021102 [Aromia moschata]|uniref:Uncharacterized protein n=1 Tax=Aromia moschata TaxID=1265417 RepID=A0AAV8XFZ1_9CUCU|nr:hypothetical protein NQ318_021102 [Aromia moschata]